MKRINNSYLLLALFIFAAACNKDLPEIDKPEPPKPPVPANLTFPKKEMRAVWMTTVWGIDWPQGDYNTETQKQQYVSYLDKFKQLNINAIFFQVKGMGDAFYNSPYEPWSKYITGERGKAPNYDVLRFMIDEAHKRDIEFHAWMNPYRIGTRANNGTPYPPLHASVKPEWVVNHEKIQIYNPALPEVRQRLNDIVKDLITKYDVDGIHFDDYFYPAPSSAGEMVSDQTDYEKYGAAYNSIQDFRRANVDKAIKGVHDVIVSVKPEIVFSISPAPNKDYNFNTLFADVTKWCQEGWLDVVIPQLYQEIGNKYNDFQFRLGWWSQYNYKATLMIGHGYYKFGDPKMPVAFQSPIELERQFGLTRNNKKVLGNALYSAKYILLNKVGVTDKLASLYKTPAVMPFLGRETAPVPAEPQNVTIENGQLKWTVSGNVKSVIYFFSDLKKEAQVIAITKDNSIALNSNGYYCVSTINKDNKESRPSKTVEKK